jgi:HK97 gp10 family phage protein
MSTLRLAQEHYRYEVKPMSAVIQVTVEYAAELAAALKENFPSASTQAVQDAVTLVGQRIYDEALRLVPVRTGYLRSSISVEPSGKWVLKILARAHYSVYVEFGTRRMEPRLFMTRALEMHAAELMEEVENGVARAIQDTFR